MKFAGQKLRAAAIASAIVHCGFISFARSRVISSAQKDELVLHSGLVTGKSRLLSAIISGGMIVDSTPVADSQQARDRASAVYDNRNLFAVATEGKGFRPIEGDTGNKAATTFVRPSVHRVYLAVFNYSDKQPQTIPLNRIDPNFGTSLPLRSPMLRQAKLQPAHGAVSVTLQPAESELLEPRADQ